MDASTRIFFVIVAVIIAAALVLRDRGPEVAPAPSVVSAGDGLAIAPVPGQPGPYGVCPQEYDTEIAPGHRVKGVIYAPVLDERACTTYPRRFNLVVIAHADGVSNDYNDYAALGTHLASNAFIAVSIHRYPDSPQAGAWMVFDQELTDNLHYLYNQSGVRNHLGERIGLVGHSAGGRSVIYNGDAVTAFGKQLAAVVALSATVGNAPITLNDVTPAFLGVHVTGDSDTTAYGSKSEGEVMQSVFRIYDEAGLTADPDQFGLEKDMLFFSHSGHYYQDRPFVLAYVNAYLQAHVNGHAAFRRFFKHQERPPSLVSTLPADQLLQMHEDTGRLTLDDFEAGGPGTNTLNVQNEFIDTGLSSPREGPAYELDEFSPHSTGVLLFGVRPPAGGGATGTLLFPFPSPTNVAGYRYLGLRATQLYNPQSNPAGEAQNIRVTLETAGGKDTVTLKDAGAALRFHPVIPIPAGAGVPIGAAPEVTNLNGSTKNAMRSYLFSLRDFEGVDLGAVTGVRLSFEDVTQSTDFIIDDIAFYRF